MSDGRSDIQRAAEALATRLPVELSGLARLAYNYRWCWLPGGADLFREIDPRRWELDAGNPVRLLEGAAAAALARAAADESYVGRVVDAERLVAEDMGRSARDCGAHIDERHPIAFFCAEYAVHSCLPIYSGGLGALAGDLLKQASDQAVPLVAVGLMYREGYFRQRIDASGWQHEYWVATDPDRLPAALVTDGDGQPLTVGVPLGGRRAIAQIWRVQVGRVALFLLDSDRPENDRVTRWITSRLYVSDPELRLAQYALLGIGGVRALAAMELEPGLVHLNEGHAALAAMELARDGLAAGLSPQQALRGAAARTVFTTHTPVPAGNDSYPVEQVRHLLGSLAAELGVDLEALTRLGRSHPDEVEEPFGVTQLALRSSDAANAVSRRHGEVAREMWQDLWPERTVADVPITHVTNGVHVPTWVGAPMRRLLDHHLRPDWMAHVADPSTWTALDDVPAADLWAARNEQRTRLVDYLRNRSVSDRLGRGDLVDYAEAAAQSFSPDTLTIGFARRLATYKRMSLLMSDWSSGAELLRGERPIQLVLAGKAHPRDEEAKRRLQELFALKSSREVAERVIFLDDYDLESAAQLVQGCDLWVNLPRPPLEASGTSGMKSVVNGGLQLSVLDGWWAEGYAEANGWALSGEVNPDHEAQDASDGRELRRLVAEEVVPLFHHRDEDGLPAEWIQRMRTSMGTLIPAFSAQRMLDDYLEGVYRRSRVDAG